MAPAGGEDNLTQIEMLARPGAKNGQYTQLQHWPVAAGRSNKGGFPTAPIGVDVGKPCCNGFRPSALVKHLTTVGLLAKVNC